MNTAVLNEGRTRIESNALLDELSENIERVLQGEASIEQFLAGRTLADIERRAIIATIRAHKGNKAASARSLGISEKSIYNKMRRLRISHLDLEASGKTEREISFFG